MPLLESTLDENEDQRERVAVIKRQTEEVSSVISEVQFLLEANERPPDLEQVDLRPVFEDELRNIRDRYENVEAELDAPPEMPVMADDLLRRVFSNLFRNALKHDDSERARVGIGHGDGREPSGSKTTGQESRTRTETGCSTPT